MKKMITFAPIFVLIFGMSCTNKNNTGATSDDYIIVDTTKFSVIEKGRYYLVDTTYSTNYPKPGEPYNVLVLTVPITRQPYRTPGYHYWNKAGQMIVLVSSNDTGSDHPLWDEFLSFHEITEAMQCVKHAIPQKAMDSFDKQWVYVPGSGIEEPGADLHCPYHEAHMKALEVEHKASDADGNNWDFYNKEMYRLQQPSK